MNILIPDSWLREHLKTKATTKNIAEYLSLCSQSVERAIKINSDTVYDIEITTNRPDCLALYGIARELAAILPRFNIPAKLIPIQKKEIRSGSKRKEADNITHPKDHLPLKVVITESSLCPRFSALIFDNVKIKPSPKIVQDRLVKSGIRALNNVVDISNYLMLELNQPMHTFDYDKIKNAKMILREAKEGESIVTLDEQIRNLPKGTIVIEDGDGRIIDLCGIMGGLNSAVDEKTKRVLLFVQSYEPAKIRRTCQLLGFRTDAASRFEKGIDSEGVMTAMERATKMFMENCDAQIASNLIDIYPNPPKPKTVSLNQNKLNTIMGVEIKLTEAKKILESLGFQSTISGSPRPARKSGEAGQQSSIRSSVPHWRFSDVSIPEDLIEEIARIYGYFNLPVKLPDGQIPVGNNQPFLERINKLKYLLKGWGFIETYNYSLISGNKLEAFSLDPEKYLKVANPLTEDLVYLRPTLLPSLLDVLLKNQSEFEKIQIFEQANVYLPGGDKTLPDEIPFLAALITKSDFENIKGYVEAIFEEYGIYPQYEQSDGVDEPWAKGIAPEESAVLRVNGEFVGIFGKVDSNISLKMGIKENAYSLIINLKVLVNNLNNLKKYQPIPKYPPVIEDFSFILPEKTAVGEIITFIKATDTLIGKVQLLDKFENTTTFRVMYLHHERTLKDEEIKVVRNNIVHSVSKKFNARLKTAEEIKE